MSVHNRHRRRTQRPATRTTVAIDPQAQQPIEADSTDVAVPTIQPIGQSNTRTTQALRNRGTRSVQTSRSVAPSIDYTKDYQYARTDLRWIALWAVLLFALMFVLRFSGLV